MTSPGDADSSSSSIENLVSPLYQSVCESSLYNCIERLRKKANFYEYASIMEKLQLLVLLMETHVDRRKVDQDARFKRIIIEFDPPTSLFGCKISTESDEDFKKRREEEAKSDHQKDIELVMSQTGCTHEDADAALAENQDDIVNAIMAVDAKARQIARPPSPSF